MFEHEYKIIFLIATIYLVVVIALFLPGCVSPKNWHSDRHADVMMVCRSMCGKERVHSYVPFTGECTCESQQRE
jgi:hypothetical protein